MEILALLGVESVKESFPKVTVPGDLEAVDSVIIVN